MWALALLRAHDAPTLGPGEPDPRLDPNPVLWASPTLLFRALSHISFSSSGTADFNQRLAWPTLPDGFNNKKTR